VFVGAAGSPYAAFRRALEAGNLTRALTEARDLHQVSPADALALLLLIADQAPERYERAAARWAALLVDAARSMTLADLELVVTALRVLPRNARGALETLVGVATAYGVADVSRLGRLGGPNSRSAHSGQ
jgi:hypothetical protein